MKLPELREFNEPGSMDGISRFELAKLHCLRSIAVSLELLTGMYATTKSEGLFRTTAELSQLHSVMCKRDKEEENA